MPFLNQVLLFVFSSINFTNAPHAQNTPRFHKKHYFQTKIIEEHEKKNQKISLILLN